jgi:hypothetical protein
VKREGLRRMKRKKSEKERKTEVEKKTQRVKEERDKLCSSEKKETEEEPVK